MNVAVSEVTIMRMRACGQLASLDPRPHPYTGWGPRLGVGSGNETTNLQTILTLFKLYFASMGPTNDRISPVPRRSDHDRRFGKTSIDQL